MTETAVLTHSPQKLEAWGRTKVDIIRSVCVSFADQRLGVDDAIVWIKREYRFAPDRKLVRHHLFVAWVRLWGNT